MPPFIVIALLLPQFIIQGAIILQARYALMISKIGVTLLNSFFFWETMRLKMICVQQQQGSSGHETNNLPYRFGIFAQRALQSQHTSLKMLLQLMRFWSYDTVGSAKVHP